MGSYGNDVWLSCSWCATPETISYHTDVDGAGLLCLRCFPLSADPSADHRLRRRSPPPPTPPLSEETKVTKAKRQRRETLERWHSAEERWKHEEWERQVREGGKEEEDRRRRAERAAGEAEDTDVDEEGYAMEMEQLQHAAASSRNPAAGSAKKK